MRRSGPADASNEDEVSITLLGVPVGLFRRSSDYHEELMRECALLLVNEPSGHGEVPGRLVRIAGELRDRYLPLVGPESQFEAAESRGETTVDLTFSMPKPMGDDVARLGELLEAAEAYSVRGKLLTVAPPAEVRLFRRWYVREIVDQLAGAGPSRWTEG